VKKERSNPMRRINSLLARVVLPKVNTIIERGRVEKQVDPELMDNKYKDKNISEIIHKLSLAAYNSGGNLGIYTELQKDSFNKLLYNIYSKTISNASGIRASYNKDVNGESVKSSYFNRNFS
jgi:hypothetical protein